MFNFFTWFHHFASKRKVFFSVLLLLIIILSVISVSKIKFQEDVRSLIPSDERINKINKVLSQSKFADQIIITFSLKDKDSSNPDALISAAEKVVEQLEKDTIHISSVKFTNNSSEFMDVYNFMYNNIPLYLTESDYEHLEKLLSPEEIEKTLESDYKSLTSLVSMITKDFIFKDPLNITPLALKKLENFQLDKNFNLYKDCIFTKDRKNLLVFVHPVFPASNTKENSKLIEYIDSTLGAIRNEFKNVHVEYYGGTAVAVVNADRVKKDVILTVTIAIVLMTLLIFVIFRRIKTILLIFFPILLGILISLAIMVMYSDEISAIALGIGAILIGISLDYSLHAFTHIRSSKSPVQLLENISLPVIMSCLSTVSAFLCLYVVRSQALNQLGIFAALAVFFTAMVVLMVLPFFFKSGKDDSELTKNKPTVFDKIAAYRFENNRILIGIIVLLTVVFFFSSKKLGFNSDISSLNYLTEELEKSEKNLKSISSEASSAVYLIVQDPVFDNAIKKAEKNELLFQEILNDSIITSVISSTDLILSEEKQKVKIARWNEFWEKADKEKIKSQLKEKGEKFNFNKSAFEEFYVLLDNEFKVINHDAFTPVTEMFLSNYLSYSDSLYSVITIVKTERNKKNQLFEKCSVEKDIIIFDNQYYTNQFLGVLKDDFNLLVAISIILVFSILLLFFGRIEIAVISFFPILLSWLWTIGIMGLFGIEFNIFNIIISTLIMGLGVDYSIFITSGLINNHKTGNHELTPYKLSVLLSALTTILCLGVLIFAKHPALLSIAVVSISGILSVLIITYTVLPLLFSFIVNNKGKKRKEPVTMLNFTISVFSLFLFILGTILATILLPLIIILPAKKPFKKRIVHNITCITSRIIVYVNFTIKKKYINKHKLDFSKPVIFISNHQSHLDLVLLLLMNPRIIMLTNKWVWDSPFFGFIVRYIGFYPTFKGLDYGIDKIAQKVKEGYSVLIFPEGTRTTDGRIGRFHQGAFYLADKLNLEIQPIIIHGAMQSLAKEEFFLKSAVITLTIFDRIKPKTNSIEIEETYRHQAKAMRQFFSAEFDKIRSETETPSFYKRLLISQYIYKGPVLEWYMRIKLRLENYYTDFHKILPAEGNIIDIGCGYGFMSYMLHLLSDKRIITGIDYDEQKISVAKNCQIKSDKINFIYSDIFEYEFGNQDAFIMSDVLHYFNEEKQKMLIIKCINNLNPGGIILIRDADTNLKKRHLGTRYTEFFSTNSGFNKMGEGKLTFTSSEMIKDIVKNSDLDLQIIDNTKFTSNIIYIITKNDLQTE